MRIYLNKGVYDAVLNIKNFKWVIWDSKTLNSEIVDIEPEQCLLLLNMIFRIGGEDFKGRGGLIELNSGTLCNVLGKDYIRVIGFLLEEGIIYSDHQYIVGEKSIGYGINIEYLSDGGPVSIELKNYINKKRLIKLFNKKDELKVSNKLKNNFIKGFKIDYDGAMGKLYKMYINGEKDHKGRIFDKWTKSILEIKLLRIKEGDLKLNRNKTNGRINTNLTFLNGDFKEFIYDYEYSLDLVSSQPLLLALFIDIITDIDNSKWINILKYIDSRLKRALGNDMEFKNFKKGLLNITKPSGNDIKYYRSICLEGTFYERIISQWKKLYKNDISRTDIKDYVFLLFYGEVKKDGAKWSRYSKMDSLFNGVSPSILRFIYDIKSINRGFKGHRYLSIILQSLESFLFIEDISAKLDDMNIEYLTIHDAFIVKEVDKDRVELKMMERIWDLFKIDAPIKVEKIK